MSHHHHHHHFIDRIINHNCVIFLTALWWCHLFIFDLRCSHKTLQVCSRDQIKEELEHGWETVMKLYRWIVKGSLLSLFNVSEHLRPRHIWPEFPTKKSTVLRGITQLQQIIHRRAQTTREREEVSFLDGLTMGVVCRWQVARRSHIDLWFIISRKTKYIYSNPSGGPLESTRLLSYCQGLTEPDLIYLVGSVLYLFFP